MTISSSRLRVRTDFAGVLIVSLVLLVGCGGPRKSATLAGKVTYPTADKPVTGGAITLHPSDGRPLSAAIKWDGTFTIGEIPAGEMKVTIETESIRGLFGGISTSMPGKMKPPGGEKSIPFDAANIPKYVRVPRKYADPKTTPLTCTVETTGGQTRDFNLTD